MTEYVVLWAGRGGMPHEIAGRSAWAQKDHPLHVAARTYGIDPETLPRAKDLQGKGTPATPWKDVAPHHCVCGKPISPSQWTARIRECWKCREQKRLRERRGTTANPNRCYICVSLGSACRRCASKARGVRQMQRQKES